MFLCVRVKEFTCTRTVPRRQRQRSVRAFPRVSGLVINLDGVGRESTILQWSVYSRFRNPWYKYRVFWGVVVTGKTARFRRPHAICTTTEPCLRKFNSPPETLEGRKTNYYLLFTSRAGSRGDSEPGH